MLLCSALLTFCTAHESATALRIHFVDLSSAVDEHFDYLWCLEQRGNHNSGVSIISEVNFIGELCIHIDLIHLVP